MMTTSPHHRAARLPLAVISATASASGKRRLAGISHWLKALAILCCLVNVGAANTFGLFTYTDWGAEIEITAYPTTAVGAVVIPTAIIGKPVTKIGDGAFRDCSQLTSVTIPASVLSIGDFAFMYCSGLTSVTIPPSVTSIGWCGFGFCNGLTSATIPRYVLDIVGPPFPMCTNLTSVLVDADNPNFCSLDGVVFNKLKTQIIQHPCNKAGNFTIPGSVSSIGDWAFRNCGKLTGVTIPGSVMGIGYSAFEDCTALSSVTIPDSVTSIGAYAFQNCTNLANVMIGDRVTSIPSVAFFGCISLANVSIGDSVTSIGSQAFKNCRALTSVTLPQSLIGISDHSFYSCTALTNVTLPTSVTSIGNSAFYDCRGLISVTIPGSVTSIRDSAFNNCVMLTSAIFLGKSPTMGTNVFDMAASGFSVYYIVGAQGFSTPAWKGYTAYPRQIPQFTSPPLPANSIVGEAYSHNCSATGIPTVSFAVTLGSLPNGLAISSAGVISGTPTTPGTFSGTITASNGFLEDAPQSFSIQVRDPWIFTSGGTNGTIGGGGSHGFNTTATLTATGNSGYVFATWSGDATGVANPLSVLVNGDKTITATFTPDTSDDDEDGLTNFQEIVEHGTDHTKQDTDGDGVNDKQDGRPLDPTETLDTDRDGTGDNADPDDDGDGFSDEDEINVHHTNPKSADSDGDGLTDPAELQTHHTDPNLADSDNDGLRDGEEFTTYHTNPLIGDTDGDGFLDGYEVLTGKLPLDPLDKPALVAEVRTAIEFTFPAAIGKTYRIEASTDLAAWAIVESGIAGTGGEIQRFYSTRGQPKRYFRVEVSGT